MRVAVFSTKPYDRVSLGAANAAGAHELVFLEARLDATTVAAAAGSPRSSRMYGWSGPMARTCGRRASEAMNRPATMASGTAGAGATTWRAVDDTVRTLPHGGTRRGPGPRHGATGSGSGGQPTATAAASATGSPTSIGLFSGSALHSNQPPS